MMIVACKKTKKIKQVAYYKKTGSSLGEKRNSKLACSPLLIEMQEKVIRLL